MGSGPAIARIAGHFPLGELQGTAVSLLGFRLAVYEPVRSSDIHSRQQPVRSKAQGLLKADNGLRVFPLVHQYDAEILQDVRVTQM